VKPAHRASRAAATVLVAAALTGCSADMRDGEPPDVGPNRLDPHSPPPAPPRREPRPAAAPDTPTAEEETDAQAWESIAAALGRPGELKDGVYRVVFPRDDLDVTIEGNAVPAGAGVESDFRFYRCPCGRINVAGQFVVADYEANDVVNELQLGHLSVASLAPLMLDERPRLLLIRFFGENHSGGALAKTLRSALAWTGKERMAPRKLD
jgi:hypothetical protein